MKRSWSTVAALIAATLAMTTMASPRAVRAEYVECCRYASTPPPTAAEPGDGNPWPLSTPRRIPEPSGLLLVGAGIVALRAVRRRRGRASGRVLQSAGDAVHGGGEAVERGVMVQP